MYTYLEFEWNGSQSADFGGVKNQILIPGAFDYNLPSKSIPSPPGHKF